MRAEEQEAFSTEYVEKMRRNSDQNKKELQKIIARGIDEGLLPTVDPYYLACMLLGLMEGMEIQWLENPEAFDLRKAMDMVIGLSAMIQPYLGELTAKE